MEAGKLNNVTLHSSSSKSSATLRQDEGYEPQRTLICSYVKHHMTVGGRETVLEKLNMRDMLFYIHKSAFIGRFRWKLLQGLHGALLAFLRPMMVMIFTKEEKL